MNILETYWTGVLQRLQAEVDVFNKLIEHQGEKGQQNELSLARIIERLIPGRYGVGSGLVIDSYGSYSTQTDIIIFNRADEPALMAQSGQVLFPIENVRACIEVKTSASSEEIKDAGEKFHSVRKLHSKRPPDRAPILAFLGYNAKTSAKALAGNLSDLPANERPDLACVLRAALMAGRENLLDVEGSGTNFRTGVAELHRTDNQSRTSGDYESAPEDWEDLHTIVNGKMYPLVPFPHGRMLVGEPSRALLLFCDALVKGILHSDDALPATFSHYIPSIARELTRV